MQPAHATGTEAEVCADIAARQQIGIAKYKTTVQDNPLSLREWLQHAYEETLDQAIYLKRAISEVATTESKSATQTSQLRAEVLSRRMDHFRRTTGQEPTHAILTTNASLYSMAEFEHYMQLAPHLYWCNPKTTWYDLPKVSGVDMGGFYLAHRQANNAWIVVQPKSDAHAEWEHLWLWAWTCANEDPEIARRICREAEEREAQRPAPPPPSWLYSATAAGLHPIQDRYREGQVMGELNDIVNKFVQTVTDWCTVIPEAQHLKRPENSAPLIRWLAARLAPHAQVEYLKEPFPELGKDAQPPRARTQLGTAARVAKPQRNMIAFLALSVGDLTPENVRQTLVNAIKAPPLLAENTEIRMPHQLWEWLRVQSLSKLRDVFGGDFSAAVFNDYKPQLLFGYKIQDWSADGRVEFYEKV